MSLDCLLNIMAGLGMFLFGMKLLSDSLEGFSGKEMQQKLQNVAATPLKGVILGAGVTGIIQSSTATTLIVMGLVNAGTMSIYEALPVIMGANIGTTVTGQILSLADISREGLLFSVLKPSFFAPFFLLAGTAELIFIKKKELQHGANIFIGLGILFSGMQIMENGLSPLARSESFCNMFLLFRNPILSILIGALMTAVIQSSSVSVGILQTLSSTNAIPFCVAVPIILGMNIGKCLPELVASFSTNKNTRRAISADLLVNTAGVIIAFLVLYGTEALFGIPFWNRTATRSMIADFHTAFNVATTFALLPFYKWFIRLSKFIIR